MGRLGTRLAQIAAFNDEFRRNITNSDMTLELRYLMMYTGF